MNKKEVFSFVKKTWSKFWYLLFKDESLFGWVFSIVFIYVFIKFLFFPSLSLLTGTSLPLAIVESCSMYHEGNLFSNFDNWWEGHHQKYENFGISKNEFIKFPFKKGFNKGDILFIIGKKPENIHVGDVIIFSNKYTKNPVIHRVIKIENRSGNLFFSTIGDNNRGQLFFEKEIPEESIIGVAKLRLIPYLGWVKLFFTDLFGLSSHRGFCSPN